MTDHEALMIEAHQAGRAYWRNNRPAARANVEQVARSCGWSDAELLAAWMAGYFGERARMLGEIDRAYWHDLGSTFNK